VKPADDNLWRVVRKPATAAQYIIWILGNQEPRL
jgi:hypothetical protein